HHQGAEGRRPARQGRGDDRRRAGDPGLRRRDRRRRLLPRRRHRRRNRQTPRRCQARLRDKRTKVRNHRDTEDTESIWTTKGTKGWEIHESGWWHRRAPFRAFRLVSRLSRSKISVSSPCSLCLCGSVLNVEGKRTMNRWGALLARPGVILADGAMGTMLF